MSIVYKAREVDYGKGKQVVEVIDGVVADQWLQSNGNHSYTGDGNPELVGKSESSLRGFGFRKLTPSQQNDLLEQRAYND